MVAPGHIDMLERRIATLERDLGRLLSIVELLAMQVQKIVAPLKPKEDEPKEREPEDG